jgi:hypothetical protein
VAEDWKRLHNEELRNLYASPNVIRVNKSRRMTWAEHVADIGEMRNLNIRSGSGRLEDLGVDGNLILE